MTRDEFLLEVRLCLREQFTELLRHLGIALDANAATAQRTFGARAGKRQQRDGSARQARVRAAVVPGRERNPSAVRREEKREGRALDGERHDSPVELPAQGLGLARLPDVAVQHFRQALEQHVST